MNINTRKIDVLLYVSILIFISFISYVLYINKEVLYTAQERSEFLTGTLFFDTLMQKPFGIIQYAGAWLTQLFYKPLIGSLVLMSIWVLIFIIGVKAFLLKGRAVVMMILPISFLLTSIVDLGYWIYIFPIRGYWFSQSLGYLLMLLLLLVARCTTPRKWHVGWYIVAFCLYPLLGWFALLFVLCLLVCGKPSWRELVGIILLFITANIWRNLLYSNLKYEDVVLAGFPRFITPSDISTEHSIPFILLGAVSIITMLGARYLVSKCVRYIPLLCIIVGVVYTLTFMYQDKNYIAEMRMVRHAEEENWKEVLKICNDNQMPTISMTMLKNVALMKEGGLLENSFKMLDNYTSIHNPDSVHVSFLEITSPLVYYNYGLLNEGFRLAFECAVQSGFSPFYLKMLSRCAFANGEEQLEKRYVSMLREHPFYCNWKPSKVSDTIHELHQSYPNELTGVENSVNYLVNTISLWYEAESKIASEQALFYSMIRCDSRRFWPSLRQFLILHQGEDFPSHPQEAYILYMDKAPEKRRMMVPVSQEIYDRYKKFWSSLESYASSGMTSKEISKRMYDEYGDTYWYYNIFGKKIN